MKAIFFLCIGSFCYQLKNLVHYIEFLFLIGLFLHLEIQVNLQQTTVSHFVNHNIVIHFNLH